MNKQQILKTGFFRLARNESLKVNGKYRLGAVLVKNGKPISVGKNNYDKSSPWIKAHNKFAGIHAEIDSLVGIDRQLIRGTTMYVYRETYNGDPVIAKPCQMCQNFMKHYGVKKVFYTINNGFEKMRI